MTDPKIDQNPSEETVRLISGVRPDGPLHLGHYVDALQQWLAYQKEYECYFMIADVQALSVHVREPEVIAEAVRNVVLDWLAVGLDPSQCRFLIQSQIPELAELTVFLQPLVRTEELRRNPTVRREGRSLGQGYLDEAFGETSFGFLGYPISQAADILAFSTTPPKNGDRLLVPVGRDQVPHVEFARLLARRFNESYGRVFIEPEEKTADIPVLPGTDGGFKMGRNPRNAIYLNEPENEYARKIGSMFTDPQRIRQEDPGHPDECPCFVYLQAFGEKRQDLGRRRDECLAAETDCNDCKDEIFSAVREFLEPIQERRAEFEKQSDYLEDVLSEGTQRAREEARTKLEAVREVMNLTYPGLIRRKT